MKGLPEAWSKESPPALSTNVSRPSSLFQSGSNVHHEAANMGQDLKDLYLQDLSDGMLSAWFFLTASILMHRKKLDNESI